MDGKKLSQSILIFSLITWLHNSIANETPLPDLKMHALLQAGYYWSIQGKNQHINFHEMIGDQFTIIDHDGSMGLLGVGLLMDGPSNHLFKTNFGVDAFYLARTKVTGNVIEENLFTNFSYQYDVTHYPLFALARTSIQTRYPKLAFTIDGGIGPNFIKMSGFQEYPLDPINIPDHVFSTHTSVTFAATAGFSIKINQVFASAPVECGYRFFYLGKGQFNSINSQNINPLTTGQAYANALICSITI